MQVDKLGHLLASLSFFSREFEDIFSYANLRYASDKNKRSFFGRNNELEILNKYNLTFTIAGIIFTSRIFDIQN